MLSDSGHTVNGSRSDEAVAGGSGSSESSAVTPPYLGEHNTAEKKCLAALKRLGLEPAVPVIFNKEHITRGVVLSGDQQVQLSSNVFGLK
uniref:Uncharacterized protein n=1 Tax=Panagrolaimus sp. ES5 TaxID=591445 RepID=A0AC34GDS9_9BILA